MGSDEQIYKEISAVFRQRRLKRTLLVGITLVLLVILNYGCSYAYAVARIAQAKNLGVYPTIEEAVTGTHGQGFGGAHVKSISSINCSPNEPDGLLPFVWFCTARVKMDRVPDGYDKSEWLAGNFFIHIQDGWVFMSEGSFPGFIGRVMEQYNLEGVNEWSATNQ